MKRNNKAEKSCCCYRYALTAFILLSVWHLLSRRYNAVIFPGPRETFRSLWFCLGSLEFYRALTVSFIRLFVALVLSALIGFLYGILMGVNKTLENLLNPILYLIQSVPPILYMTFAMIWFGLNGRAAIFIVTIVSFPVLAVSLFEGFSRIDPGLVEVGHVFRFSRRKILSCIIIPSLVSSIKSGLMIMIGLSWKILIMSEILSSGTGLGAMLTEAKMNLETDKVFALGVVVVFLCIASQKSMNKGVKQHDS